MLQWLHGAHEHLNRVTQKMAIGGEGDTHEGESRCGEKHAQALGCLRTGR